MAALQQTLIPLQSKTPIRRRLPLSLSPKPHTLSFPLRPSRGGVACMCATAASSYATALLDVAVENNTVDATCADVDKIEKIIATDPDVIDFFSNPTLDDDSKQALIDDVAGAASLQPHTANLLRVLVDAQRMDIVNEVVKEFELVHNELTDTELAVVSSVVPLEPQHLAQIAKQVQRLTGSRNVRIKSVIDPGLVAGFTVRYGLGGSKLIDMSVKKQLEEIAAQLELNDMELAV